jgi:hypothetical protein
LNISNKNEIKKLKSILEEVVAKAGYDINSMAFKNRKLLNKVEKINSIIKELRMENPYPSDIFTGKTEEGKIGQFGKKVWNNCLDELEKSLKE